MIRKATVSDFQAVLAFAPMMMTQALFRYDERTLAVEVLSTIQAGECFVAECDGEIIGTSAYDVSQGAWYTKECALFDKWIAVKEEHRGGVMAGKLILALEREADKLGIPFMPAVAGSQSHAGTFTKRYGQPVAALYKKAS